MEFSLSAFTKIYLSAMVLCPQKNGLRKRFSSKEKSKPPRANSTN